MTQAQDLLDTAARRLQPGHTAVMVIDMQNDFCADGGYVQMTKGGDMSGNGPLAKKIMQQIRANTTPRHVPDKVLQVTDIPRTRSGKIVELAVRNVVHNLPVKNVEALANPEALELFRNRVELQS